MSTGVASWSQTASDNDDADANVDWQEGMAPSQVNDSARSMMASVAKWRDDFSGQLVTGGSSTAYTLTTNQSFDSLSLLDGKLITFRVHATSGSSPTLNIDSLGAKALHSVAGTAPRPGALLNGAVYAATYDNANNRFVIWGNPAPPSVEIGTVVDFAQSTPPNGWLPCDGRAISRTTYAALYALFGSPGYGTGDGSTTFNLPDLRGRVVAGADNMGTGAANRLTGAGGVGGSIGQSGGTQTHTLTTTEMPSHNHGGATGTESADHTHGVPAPQTKTGAANSSGSTFGYWFGTGSNDTSTGMSGSHTHSISAQGGGGAHSNMQPTFVMYKIIFTGVYT